VKGAFVIGGDLVVEGTIRGAAVVIGGDVQVMPGAIVEDGVYAIGGALHIDNGARVAGSRVQVAGGNAKDVFANLTMSSHSEQAAAPRWIGPLLRFIQMVALFALALLLVFLAPGHVEAVRQTLLQERSKVTIAGLGLLLGFVPACLLLALSVLGIPLIPLAVLALLSAFVLGLTALSAALGYRLPIAKHPESLSGAMMLGMLLLALAVLVPVLGGILFFLTSFYGAGAVLLSRFGTRSPPKEPNPEPPGRVGMPASIEH
jgi:hypothetical protein